MRTDPFTDSFWFLLGATSDHATLGWGRWAIVLLFIGLLMASVGIAAASWRADAAQRTAGNLWTWLFRVLLGVMWFQGSLWKLPLPNAGGLQYWTEQMAEHAAFAVGICFSSRSPRANSLCRRLATAWAWTAC
jgi:hypothetical protein